MYPKFPKPLWWHAGQFIDPQHFQESDRFHAHHSQLAVDLCRPFPWGVRKIQVNSAALANGTLAFDHAEILFPDGTYALWTGQRDEGNVYALHCKLDGIPDDGAVIQAVLQTMRETENAAAAPDALMKADKEANETSIGSGRFIPLYDERETPDRYGVAGADSINPTVLTRLYYNIKLAPVTVKGPEAGAVAIPLAKVVNHNGKFRLDESFIPPLFAASASAQVARLTTDVAKALRKFPGQLAEAGTTDPAAKIAELFSQQAAAGLAAELGVIAENPDAHPYELYALLKRRHAELASAAAMTGMPPTAELPPYDHARPSEWLPPLAKACRELLAGNFPRVVVCVEPLYDEVKFRLYFKLPEAARSHKHVVLSLPVHKPLGSVLEEGRLIAGSPDNVERAVRQAVSVVPLRPMPPPRGLPSTRGNEYVTVDTGSDFWDEAQKSGELAVAYYPGEQIPAETIAALGRLYVLEGRKE